MKRGPKKGQRFAGRQKGTPNKATDETRALIESALGCNPLQKMAVLAEELLSGKRVLLVPVTRRVGNEIVHDTEESDAKAIELAVKLLSEISQYHSPKRKAVEVSGPDGGPIMTGTLKVELVQARAK